MAPTKRAKLSPWGGSLTRLEREVSAFRSMDQSAVQAAGLKAAGVIRTTCQDIIFTEGDLDEYSDVAEATKTWVDDDNVWVGIQDGPLKERADQMNDRVYPVIETAFHMAQAEAVEAFETELRFS